VIESFLDVITNLPISFVPPYSLVNDLHASQFAIKPRRRRSSLTSRLLHPTKLPKMMIRVRGPDGTLRIEVDPSETFGRLGELVGIRLGYEMLGLILTLWTV